MTNRKTLASGLMLAVAAGIALLMASIAVGIVEDRSRVDVERQLMLTGHEWVGVEADGLNIVLSGEAADEATRFKALREVARVVDAGRLRDQISILVAAPLQPPKFSLEILQNADGISLIGLVPASTDIEAITNAIAENSGGQPVTELVDQADYPAPENWEISLGFAVLALSVLDRSKISVTAGDVDIVASAGSEAERRDLDTRIRASAAPAINVSLQIDAPRPVVTPYTLRFTIENERPRFEACTSDTEEGADMIIAAAVAAGLTGPQRCTVALGVPSPDWDEAAIMAIIALDEVGAGTVSMSDTDITLMGQHGTDPAEFDRVTGTLNGTLPDVFTLNAFVADAPETQAGPSAAGSPVFLATLSPEGLVQLRGQMPTERARLAAGSLARAEFGARAVTDALRLRDDLPARWPVRVYAGLSALSELRNGTLEVTADALKLSGSTGSVDTSSRIAGMLSDKLGTAEEISLNIDYVEALDPEAALPEPQECVDQINAVMARQKITFAPGSADIDAEGRKSMAEIVEIMKTCEHVPMEVAGHTDSQGREVMNKELSQARANAVVDALLARRVLTSNLVAKGYGEEQPIADNGTEEGREANRRIEFHLISADPAAEPDAADDADGQLDAADDAAVAPEDDTAPQDGDTGGDEAPMDAVDAADTETAGDAPPEDAQDDTDANQEPAE